MSDASGPLGDAWRDHRHYVLDVAFRMVGNIAEAEDIVQEAFVRLWSAQADEIADIRGWLVVVVTRLCLDYLRSARVRRDAAQPPTAERAGIVPGSDPADRITLDDSIRLALFVVLERLTPAERAAFVLHDVFAFDFDAVAAIVGRTPAAVRKLASRARKRIEDGVAPSRFDVDPVEQRVVAERFIAACAGGDLNALMDALDRDVVGVVEFGRGGGRRLEGREAVGGNLMRLFGPGSGHALVSLALDGGYGLLAFADRRPVGLLRLVIRTHAVHHIDATADPGVLSALAQVVGAPRAHKMQFRSASHTT